MIVIYDNDEKKGFQVVAGQFDEKTQTFFKQCTENHWCRIFRGFGIGEIAVETLKKLECKIISIAYLGEIRDFSFEAWVDYNFKKDIGSGFQYFYPWNKKIEEYIPLRVNEFKDPDKNQMKLF